MNWRASDEINETERQIPHGISYTWNLEIVKFIETESKYVVPGDGAGAIGRGW